MESRSSKALLLEKFTLKINIIKEAKSAPKTDWIRTIEQRDCF